jgi:hypothetical protein
MVIPKLCVENTLNIKENIKQRKEDWQEYLKKRKIQNKQRMYYSKTPSPLIF